MKLNLIKWEFDNSEYCSYKLHSIKKCCDEIINTDNIDLMCKYTHDDIIKICFCYDDEIVEYGEQWVLNNYIGLSYCPFCGEFIEIDITEVVDMNKTYEELVDKVYSLRREIDGCDSKKQSSELEKQFRETNGLLSNIWENYSFHKDNA